MRSLKTLAIAGALCLLAGLAQAQSTAQQVILGYLTTVGCAGAAPACWMPYTNANPLPTTGGGGGGGGAITAAAGSYAAGAFSAGAGVDGWDLTEGSTTDTAATAGGTGTVSAKLREVTSQLATIASNTSPGCVGATVSNTKTKPFSNAGSASNLLLVSGVSAENVHICAVNIGPVAAAVNVALVEGTTTTNACDTGTAGVTGGATAATGWQLAANGGLTFGNGVGLVGVTATLADNVCLLFSTGVQVSGVITYAVF